MNNIESFEQKKSEIDLFREEIENIRKREMEKKEQEEKYDPHFDDIKPEELTEEDRVIYEKFKDDSMIFKEFSDYQQRVLSEADARRVSGAKESRVNFCAWITNRISGDEKWLKKFRIK